MAKRVLKLSAIRLDGNTQPRVELDEGLIAEYKEAYLSKAEMPPLEVMFDGASYWLWDGFHRRWAADRAGMEKVPCNVTDGTREDAQWASYGANVTHGLRRRNEDKQKAVKAALRHPNGPKCSNVEVATHCGVDEKTVRKYRDEMTTTSEIPKSDSRTGRDGRTINTANIGKLKPDQEPEPEQKPMPNPKPKPNPEPEKKNPTGNVASCEPATTKPDASGGTEPVTSGQLAGMEPDSAGVDFQAADQAVAKFKERLTEWTQIQFRNIDDLNWQKAAVAFIELADDCVNWKS